MGNRFWVAKISNIFFFFEGGGGEMPADETAWVQLDLVLHEYCSHLTLPKRKSR